MHLTVRYIKFILDIYQYQCSYWLNITLSTLYPTKACVIFNWILYADWQRQSFYSFCSVCWLAEHHTSKSVLCVLIGQLSHCHFMLCLLIGWTPHSQFMLSANPLDTCDSSNLCCAFRLAKHHAFNLCHECWLAEHHTSNLCWACWLAKCHLSNLCYVYILLRAILKPTRFFWIEFLNKQQKTV